LELFPHPEFGFLNGWLLVVTFYLVNGILLILFPAPVVARIYGRSGARRAGLDRRIFGLLTFLFLSWLILSLLTPLKRGDPVLVLGLALFCLGLVGFVIALFNYKNTPLDQPVASGLYRISRHPQQLTTYLTFSGISTAMGSWLALAVIGASIIVAHVLILAEEEACLRRYGESYRKYIDHVPRYFLFF